VPGSLAGGPTVRYTSALTSSRARAAHRPLETQIPPSAHTAPSGQPSRPRRRLRVRGLVVGLALGLSLALAPAALADTTAADSGAVAAVVNDTTATPPPADPGTQVQDPAPPPASDPGTGSSDPTGTPQPADPPSSGGAPVDPAPDPAPPPADPAPSTGGSGGSTPDPTTPPATAQPTGGGATSPGAGSSTPADGGTASVGSATPTPTTPAPPSAQASAPLANALPAAPDAPPPAALGGDKAPSAGPADAPSLAAAASSVGSGASLGGTSRRAVAPSLDSALGRPDAPVSSAGRPDAAPGIAYPSHRVTPDPAPAAPLATLRTARPRAIGVPGHEGGPAAGLDLAPPTAQAAAQREASVHIAREVRKRLGVSPGAANPRVTDPFGFPPPAAGSGDGSSILATLAGIFIPAGTPAGHVFWALELALLGLVVLALCPRPKLLRLVDPLARALAGYRAVALRPG
jgi:hypothetical protein